MSAPKPSVLVLSSRPPFARGGHEILAESLHRELAARGHRADLLFLPAPPFGSIVPGQVAALLSRIPGPPDGPDVVISLRYPAYLVRHPRHVVWLCHRSREYYDLWPETVARWGTVTRLKETLKRTVVRAIDNAGLRRRRGRLFAISRTVASRLERWGGHETDVLYPPPSGEFSSAIYGDYFLALGRLTQEKRVDLVIKASAISPTLPVIIAGEGPELEWLPSLARDLGVADRIEFVGAVADARKRELLAGCRAVIAANYQEDYGLVAAEAMASARPVIACEDGGGLAELVEDCATGVIAEPTPDALSRAMVSLAESAETARELGEAGRERISQVTWEATIERLLSAAGFP
jgi:glycosyltransferase involved in cell wall biosynthesis